MSDLIIIHGEDGKTFFVDKDEFISHEGVVGMKWGHRNGPPYPLSRGILNLKTKILKNQAKQENSSLNDSNNDPDLSDTEDLKKRTARMRLEARYVGAKAAERKQRNESTHYLSKVVNSYYSNRLTLSKALRKKDSIITKSLQHKVNSLRNLRTAQEAAGRILNKAKEAADAREAALMTDDELRQVTDNLLAITDWRDMNKVLYGKRYSEDLMSVASNVTLSVNESIKNAKDKVDWTDVTFFDSSSGNKKIKKENQKLKSENEELIKIVEELKKQLS